MMRPLMRWLFLVGLFACDTSSTIDLDFGLVLPGCRAPSQCWKTSECACTFASVNDPNAPDSCLVCDPNNAPDGVCTCESDGGPEVACFERAQVCVGRGPLCNGLCVRGTSNCMDPNAEPPEEVAIGDGGNGDGGPGAERHCPYIDDICCS
jgi:hypothetical protein